MLRPDLPTLTIDISISQGNATLTIEIKDSTRVDKKPSAETSSPRDNTKNIHRKRLRMPSPTRPPSTTSSVSAALKSNDFEHSQSVAQFAGPAQEREFRDIDHEMSDGGSDDSNDEDYDDMNDAATSEIRHPLP
jgi:hypothetical protein